MVCSARSQPALPMMPGMPEKLHARLRPQRTTSLFAAFNTADGTVISSMHGRHRSMEFEKFLVKIDEGIPTHLVVQPDLRQITALTKLLRCRRGWPV